MKNTVQKLELNSGEVVELTLTFAKLLKVKNHNKKLYESFMNALKNKDFDPLLDSAKVVYVAYLCGLNDDLKNALSEEEFLEELPMDLTVINQIVADLINPKKK